MSTFSEAKKTGSGMPGQPMIYGSASANTIAGKFLPRKEEARLNSFTMRHVTMNTMRV